MAIGKASKSAALLVTCQLSFSELSKALDSRFKTLFTDIFKHFNCKISDTYYKYHRQASRRAILSVT